MEASSQGCFLQGGSLAISGSQSRLVVIIFMFAGGDFFFVVASFVLRGLVWVRGLIAWLLAGWVVVEPGIWGVFSRVYQGFIHRGRTHS